MALEYTLLYLFHYEGISCPRAPNARDETSGEPFGKEALFFTKELIMHREVRFRSFDGGGCKGGGGMRRWVELVRLY